MFDLVADAFSSRIVKSSAKFIKIAEIFRSGVPERGRVLFCACHDTLLLLEQLTRYLRVDKQCVSFAASIYATHTASESDSYLSGQRPVGLMNISAIGHEAEEFRGPDLRQVLVEAAKQGPLDVYFVDSLAPKFQQLALKLMKLFPANLAKQVTFRAMLCQLKNGGTDRQHLALNAMKIYARIGELQKKPKPTTVLFQ